MEVADHRKRNRTRKRVFSVDVRDVEIDYIKKNDGKVNMKKI